MENNQTPLDNPQSFNLYTGKAPLLLQLIAGLMWLQGLDFIISGIPLIFFWGVGVILILLGAITIKVGREIFKLNKSSYKIALFLQIILFLVLVGQSIVNSFSKISTISVASIFVAVISIIIIYSYRDRFVGEGQNKSIKYAIIIGLILWAIVVALKFYLPSNTDTAQYVVDSSTKNITNNPEKIFTDSSNKFSITLPKDWVVLPDEGTSSLVAENKSAMDNGAILKIQITPSNGPILDNGEVIMVDKEQAVISYYEQDNRMQASFIHNGEYYLLTYNYKNYDSANFVFKYQILSSFKFSSPKN